MTRGQHHLQFGGNEAVGVWVGLAPFYLDVDEMGVLTGRAWLILAWKDHREDRKRERERDSIRYGS